MIKKQIIFCMTLIVYMGAVRWGFADIASFMSPGASLTNADYSFMGVHTNDNSGYSLASAGDVDGDGLGDILISSYRNDGNIGKVYLLFGSTIVIKADRSVDLASSDFSFFGENAYDYSGCSVAAAGDVDGDGLGDIIIGASGYAVGSALYVGKTYLLLGGSLLSSGTNSIPLADADYSFTGETGTYTSGSSGVSVSSAGDVDGDGLDDILIGALHYGEGGSLAGKTYLMLGATLVTSATNAFNLSSADFSFIGEKNDHCGHVVASAGDVDGDGFGDVFLGMPDAYKPGTGSYAGKACLILGSTITNRIATTNAMVVTNADFTFRAETTGDYAGYSVASAGDVDGDGSSDLLIGAKYNDEAGSRAGKSYLMLASNVVNLMSGTDEINLTQADFVFVGETTNDYSGASVSSAGDVDGDGLSDLLIGSPRNSDAVSWAGKTYLMLGSTVLYGGTNMFSLHDADYAFVGESTNDQSGFSVRSAGDVDGDGLADIVIGAPYNDDGGNAAGKTYLILSGKVSLEDADDDGLPDEWEVQYFGDITNADAAVDSDEDGFDNLSEYIAGTEPTNAVSLFGILTITCETNCIITFDSISNRIYNLNVSTNLLDDQWMVLQTNMDGVGGMISLLDTNAMENRFYRLGVSLE